MKIDFLEGVWLNKPKIFKVSNSIVVIKTEPGTDLWQRTYYGFRNDNAPALLIKSHIDFTFTVRVLSDYKRRFDQCGVIIYFDSNNWFKASVEHEDENISRLGSVVTNNGYSDWATTDVTHGDLIWYRLHCQGSDFLIESSADGQIFQQMRIFHLHFLGNNLSTKANASVAHKVSSPIQFGLYACSPEESTFEATFDCFQIENCQWVPHQT